MIDWSQIDAPTPWARASIDLMKRIAKVGLRAAAEEQLDSPALPDDLDWCRSVAAWAQGKEAPPPLEEYEFDRFRCPACRDVLFVAGNPIRRSGRTYLTVQTCAGGACPAWARVRLDAADHASRLPTRRGRAQRSPDVDL
jgi:hypothetical protein